MAAKHMQEMGKSGISHGSFLVFLLVLCTWLPILCPAFGMAGKDTFSKDLSKRWLQTVLSDSEKLERIASHLRERPGLIESTWSSFKALLDTVVHTRYPDAQIKLEGSNADGTALHGISDFDVWIDTEVALGRDERKRLFNALLDSMDWDSDYDIKPRHDGIGRKAMKFQFREYYYPNYPIDVDVVFVNMDYDIGLDENDFPSLTRSSSRNQARLRATEHVRSCRKSAAAILMMKAFTLDGRRSLIPGYFLNHFARRICQEIRGEHSAHTSSTLFYTMVKHFLSFCELQKAFQWSACPVADWHGSSLQRRILLRTRQSGFQVVPQADVIDSEILLDLWKDCVDYDLVHPGATRSARLRNSFRRASRVLRRSLTAVMDNDQNFIREHMSLKRCPENFWSK